MLKIISPYFDKEKMKNAIQTSHKNTKDKTYRNDKIGYKVPKETNYVIEIVSILRSWMPQKYTITTETNCKKRYADIHIKYNDPKKEFFEKIVENIDEESEHSGIILELISNERFSHQINKKESEDSVIGHILRTEMYGKELNSEPWVLHFITVCKFPDSPNQKDVKWYYSE